MSINTLGRFTRPSNSKDFEMVGKRGNKLTKNDKQSQEEYFLFGKMLERMSAGDRDNTSAIAEELKIRTNTAGTEDNQSGLIFSESVAKVYDLLLLDESRLLGFCNRQDLAADEFKMSTAFLHSDYSHDDESSGGGITPRGTEEEDYKDGTVRASMSTSDVVDYGRVYQLSQRLIDLNYSKGNVFLSNMLRFVSGDLARYIDRSIVRDDEGVTFNEAHRAAAVTARNAATDARNDANDAREEADADPDDADLETAAVAAETAATTAETAATAAETRLNSPSFNQLALGVAGRNRSRGIINNSLTLQVNSLSEDLNLSQVRESHLHQLIWGAYASTGVGRRIGISQYINRDKSVIIMNNYVYADELSELRLNDQVLGSFRNNYSPDFPGAHYEGFPVAIVPDDILPYRMQYGNSGRTNSFCYDYTGGQNTVLIFADLSKFTIGLSPLRFNINYESAGKRMGADLQVQQYIGKNASPIQIDDNVGDTLEEDLVYTGYPFATLRINEF